MVMSMLHFLSMMMMMMSCSIIPLGASFVVDTPFTRTRCGLASSNIQRTTASPRAFSLFAINGTDTSSSSSSSSPQRSFGDDFKADLVIADLVGLLLASQLMGLLDVLNDNHFWQTGGWLQPITLESSASSLSTLTQRFATIACLYVAGAFGCGAFSMTPTKGKESVSVVELALPKALRGTVGFFVLRVVLAIGMVVVGQQQAFAVQDVLRDTYFVALATASTRYFVYSFYNRYY